MFRREHFIVTRDVILSHSILPYVRINTDFSSRAGVALTDTFAFACSNWVTAPDNLPLQYSFAVIDPVSGQVTMLLRDFQGASAFATLLSAGAPATVRIQIQDRYVLNI